MLHSTEGIVLSNRSFGEADLLVTYLTTKFGLKSAIAKSPRKIKSRFGSSLEPFTLAKLSFWGKESTQLPRLTQSDIIRPHQGLRQNVRCFLLASEMTEIVLNFMPDSEPNQQVYDLYVGMLGRMEHECSRLRQLVFKVKFLDIKGYAPRLMGCAMCDAPASRFFIPQGAVICPKCADAMGGTSGRSIDVSSGGTKLYETLRQWDIEKLERVRASEGMLLELGALIDRHVEHALSKRLKTREFMSYC